MSPRVSAGVLPGRGAGAADASADVTLAMDPADVGAAPAGRPPDASAAPVTARPLDPPLTLVESPIAHAALPMVVAGAAVAVGIVELVGAGVAAEPDGAEDGSRPDSMRSGSGAPLECASRAWSDAWSGSDLPSLDPLADVAFEVDEDGDEDAPLEEVVFEKELLGWGFDFAFDAFGGDVFVFTVLVAEPAVVVAAANAGTAWVLGAAAAFFAWPGASDPGLTAPALPRPLPGLDVAAGASTAIAHAAISAAARPWARDGAALLLPCVDWCASMTS